MALVSSWSICRAAGLSGDPVRSMTFDEEVFLSRAFRCTMRLIHASEEDIVGAVEVEAAAIKLVVRNMDELRVEEDLETRALGET